MNESGIAFRPFGWNVDDFSTSTPEGTRTVNEIRTRVVTADLKAAWNTRFGEDISNTFLAGTQGFIRQREEKGGNGNRFPGPGLEVAEAGANQSVEESWLRNVQVGGYLQDQVGWQDWMFVTVGGRWDANSAFGEDFSTAFYPKLSGSFIPTDAFAWSSETFSTLRLRAAIGKSGLQPGAFDKFTTFSPQPAAEGPGVEPDNLGNEGLKPEVSTEIEAGAELGLFQDRASIELTYWDRETVDALVARQFPVTGGFVDTQLDNIGKVTSNGWEIAVQGNVLQSPNLSISLFANGAFLEQKIADMGGAPPLKTGGSYPRYRNYLVEGFAPGAFFGARVADVAIPLNLDGSCTEPTREQALAYFSEPHNPSEFKPLVVGNSDFGTPSGALASGNCGAGSLQTYLGKSDPDWSGSFGVNVGFLGSFELNSLFEFKAGNYFVHDLSGEFRRANASIGRNTPNSAQLEATMLNPASTAEERLDAAIRWAREAEGLSPLDGLNSIKPADYLRWRELSLTYAVPGSFIEGFGLTGMSLNFGVRNLALFVNDEYPGMDPEGNALGRCNGGLDCNFLSGTEGWNVPLTRRFTFATRISF
ncbi:MAG: TonB-dependent receptor domain-containing protein [Planctomycetaceae bacterium]